MLVEVDVPNDDGVSSPACTRARRSRVALRGGTPQVPPTRSVFRGGKVYVPVVRESRLTLAEVTLAASTTAAPSR